MDELTVRTPSKINLGLNVVSRREDGYHNIETIFYPLNLSDTLTFIKADNYKFTSDSNEIKDSPENLIIKARNLLEKESGKILKVHIHLEKKIPVGGGLGGGSSDAAATLIGLNNLFQLNMSYERLKTLGLSLGSDIPFFLNPVPSFAYSRGEMMEFLDISIPYSILIVNPGVQISTMWAYSKIRPGIPGFSLKNFNQEILNAPDKLHLYLKNDFEEVVFKEHGQIADLKKELYLMNSVFALMSGSGSTLFAFFDDYETMKKAEMKLSSKNFTFFQKPTYDI